MVPYQPNTPSSEVVASDFIGATITAWLDSKYKRSYSERTRQAYSYQLGRFREYLQANRLDLFSDPRIVATALQSWSGLPDPDGQQNARSTIGQKIRIISSFYQYVIKRQLVESAINPAYLVETPVVEDYASAFPIESSEIIEVLASIDRSTLRGMRDHAILAVGLYTGRRGSELAKIQLQDIRPGSPWRITWPRTKGAKIMADNLPDVLSQILEEYFIAAYGPAWPMLPGDTYIWVSFAKGTRKAPGLGLIRGIVSRYLDTTKTHTLRHSAAVAMEEVGMSTSEIQERLGHSDLAITGIYLKKLNRGKNTKGDELAERLGIKR